MKNILVINPGSTSTKVALYKSEVSGKVAEVFSESISHTTKDLEKFETTAAQEPFRAKAVTDFLSKNKITELDCCAGRGAPVKPLTAGSYEINELMLEELRSEKYSNHASNLGALIAHSISRFYGKLNILITFQPIMGNWCNVHEKCGLGVIFKSFWFNRLFIDFLLAGHEYCHKVPNGRALF